MRKMLKSDFLNKFPKELYPLSKKILNGERISFDDGVLLYKKG